MDKETLDIFVSHLRPIRVPRKTILIKPLVKDNNVYMIERGIARSFNLINGKEMTSWFSQEGELIYSTNSFYGTTEGYENERVQVLEDSLLYYIPIPELKELCFRHIEMRYQTGCACCIRKLLSKWKGDSSSVCTCRQKSVIKIYIRKMQEYSNESI